MRLKAAKATEGVAPRGPACTRACLHALGSNLQRSKRGSETSFVEVQPPVPACMPAVSLSKRSV